MIPGSLGHQRPGGDLVQLLDEDDIAAARLIAAAPTMRSVLQALVQWARHTGGGGVSAMRNFKPLFCENLQLALSVYRGARMGRSVLARCRARSFGAGGDASPSRRRVRFKRRPRTPYTVTDRKRAAARRLQQRQREALPLLAALVAEQQPCIDQLMEDRVRAWGVSEQSARDWQAQRWREARRILESYEPETRCALLTYWNGHRWLPADASYLLDMLGGFKRGRLVMVDGAIQPARVVISVAEATAVSWGRKPVARGWLGSQT